MQRQNMIPEVYMGKGDKRTKRGKLFRNSHGNTHPKGSQKKKK
jgi:ribosomal small subunit protein bTHX